MCFSAQWLTAGACASGAAKASAHNYVSAKTAWVYESTSVTGQAVLKLSDGPLLVLPADHNFQNQFVQATKGNLTYCDSCSSQSDDVAAYLAPDIEEVRQALKARGGVGVAAGH